MPCCRSCASARPGVRVTRTIVTGVIGADTHIVGNRILSMALEDAGYRVVSLGALTPAADFIRAAIETAADAILVSSLYGQGELDCRGFRDLCIEAGLDDILLYVGGNLVVGKQPWDAVERRFLDMGFDRAFPPGTRTSMALPAPRRSPAAQSDMKSGTGEPDHRIGEALVSVEDGRWVVVRAAGSRARRPGRSCPRGHRPPSAPPPRSSAGAGRRARRGRRW